VPTIIPTPMHFFSMKYKLHFRVPKDVGQTPRTRDPARAPPGSHSEKNKIDVYSGGFYKISVIHCPFLYVFSEHSDVVGIDYDGQLVIELQEVA
jgi:hypothetical protein